MENSVPEVVAEAVAEPAPDAPVEAVDDAWETEAFQEPELISPDEWSAPAA